MSKHYRELFASVRDRPGMLGLDGSYAEAQAFVLGCDAGNEWGLLKGFEEWLIPQIDGERNSAWTALVLRFAFPDGTPDRPWNDDDEQRALVSLFRLLDEYFEADASHSSSRAIWRRYCEWEREPHPLTEEQEALIRAAADFESSSEA